MKTHPHLNRRRFLQGIGIAITLPAFESFAVGAGKSVTSPRRLVCAGNHLGFYPGNFFPKDEGKSYTATSSRKPLDEHRDDLSVFSNLDHGLNGGHKGVHGFLSGIRKEEAAGFAEKNITLDQAAAEHVGSATRFSSITTGIDDGTSFCWNRAGVHIPPINNPAKLFQALFVASDKAGRDAERIRLMHRSSVLDALRDSAGALNRKLNAPDRDKLDQYLTSVRDVERRLQMSKEWLHRPKPKAPIDEVLDEERLHMDEMALLFDLITLALQTDSTRVATFEIPMGFRTAELDLGKYHQISHHGKEKGRIEQLQVVEAFFTTKLSNFISQLKEAKIFDETLIVFGSGMSDASKHSNRDLPVLLVGGGIKHQGHVVCPKEQHKRVPLSNLFLSALHWFGAEADHFGKSTGTFTPMELS